MSFINRILRIFIIGLILSRTVVDLLALPTQKFTRFTAEDGLDAFIVQQMFQDQYGCLWVGSWNGLYSYDGYIFKRAGEHGGEDVMDNPRITQMAQHPDGTIWIVTYDGIAYRFSAYTSQYTQLTTTDYHVHSLQMMPDGLCWMLTDLQELLVGQSSGPEEAVQVVDFFQSQSLRRPSRINHLSYDEANDMHWIMTEEGVYCYQSSTKRLQLLSSASAYEIVFDEEYCYYGGRGGVLYRCNLTSLQSEEVRLDTRSSIKRLYRMPDKRLLLLTGSDGFFLYDTQTGQSQHITTSNLPGLGDNVMRDAFVDHLGELWLRTDQPGIVHYVPATGACRRHILHDEEGVAVTEASTEQIVIEDVNQRLWVHPSGGGLAWYNRATDQLELFYNPNLTHRWNNTSPLLLLFSDQQGSLWFCTHTNGLEKASFMQYPFILEHYDPEHLSRACNNVRAIHQMQDGRIWAGCRDHSIRVFSSDYHFLGNMCRDGKLHKDRQDFVSQVYAICQGPDGNIWIGTKGEGLFLLHPNGTDSYTVRQFKASQQDRYSLGSNAIYDLHIDHKGRLWIATFENGVSILDYDIAKDSFRFYNTHNELSNYPLANCSRARCIANDDQGNIYIGTTGGLLVCNEDFTNYANLRFKHYVPERGQAKSLTATDVTSIWIARNGRSFVTTFGGGICEFVHNDQGGLDFSRIKDPTGKQMNDIVYSVVEDIHGELWTIEEGAVCHIRTDSIIERFSDPQLPMRLAFNEGLPAQLQSGELMVPTRQGAMRFHPDSLMHTDFVPNICIRNDSVLIPAGEHDLTIQYSALDFVLPEVIEYAYRLVGFDDEWHYVGNDHYAHYTNLPVGKYTFEVRSTNHSGIWVDNVRQLMVEVQPTFGETTFARVLRICGILLLTLLVGLVVLWILRLNQRVRIEERVTDQKLKLYTNLSHELRTPLTLIVGPLEQMRRSRELPASLAKQLDIVAENATHMLRTVNQMLDFRKIENGKMHLVVQQVDLVAFAEQHVRNFSLLSDSMQIPLHFDTDLQRLDIWADPEKLEHIINNLLGNAFKYSKTGHPIHVSVAQIGEKAQLVVRDEGIGIAPEQLKSIFERYSSGSGNTPSGMASSGIGLSLTRELVRMHSGQIDVKSQKGSGTTFTVSLPLGRAHFSEQTEFVSPVSTAESGVTLQSPTSLQSSATAESASVATTPVLVAAAPTMPEPDVESTAEAEQNTILIVEDNKELRAFIRQIFEGQYIVHEASDGREGLRLTLQVVPDIVISDVMMPLMDGFQMVQQIRRHPQICHISVIMLTALSDTETKLKGLGLGIDSYITKPFDAPYLVARVDNILRKRESLQHYFQQQLIRRGLDAAQLAVNIEATQMEQAPQTSDQRFVAKVVADMQANLGNPDYSVDDMASDANMSRSTYGRKFRALMGMTPTDMLRDLRLQRAGELIRTTDLNVSQVAYEVGFADPHYFGKCFKAYYQKTPSEYKNQERV